MTIAISIAYTLAMTFLWRAGGAGLAPLQKDWRRVVAPILTATYIVLISYLTNPTWWCLLVASVSGGVLWLATILPISLRGNDIKANMWWLPILGYIHGVSLIPVGFLTTWLIALIVALSVGTLYWVYQYISLLTNGKFNWAYNELAFGATYGIGLSVLMLI